MLSSQSQYRMTTTRGDLVETIYGLLLYGCDLVTINGQVNISDLTMHDRDCDISQLGFAFTRHFIRDDLGAGQRIDEKVLSTCPLSN